MKIQRIDVASWNAGLAVVAGGLLGATVQPEVLTLVLLLLALARVLTSNGGRRPTDPSLEIALPTEPAPEEANSDLAVLDALTGLWNRRGLERMLDAECRRAARTQTPVGVLVFSLRNLSQITRACGDQAGFDVLRQMGLRLRGALAGAGAVGRISGKEFVVVMPGIRPDALALIAERFRSVVEGEPVSLPSGRKVSVLAACGWAGSPRDGISAAFLIASARSRLGPESTQFALAS